jgi:hypothetical protein
VPELDVVLSGAIWHRRRASALARTGQLDCRSSGALRPLPLPAAHGESGRLVDRTLARSPRPMGRGARRG